MIVIVLVVKNNLSVGGKGSDHITSCGIDVKSNILYYIGANYHNCPNMYNTRPSIVRINLTNFSFIDRTYLNEIEGFNHYANWSYQFLNEESILITQGQWSL